jgi:uracil-DNA glycosylase
MTRSPHRPSADWPTEFRRVIGCQRCTKATDRHLLRDSAENVPQPGFVGSRYGEARVLLAGQNPGSPKSPQASEDKKYTALLRRLRDDPSAENGLALRDMMRGFMPRWPVWRYFPHAECGLELEDIAYCNVIRCRTVDNRSPSDSLARTCVEEHFRRWLQFLQPRVVVFIGKLAWEQGGGAVGDIPTTYVNRQRSLSRVDRDANLKEVVRTVREALRTSGVEDR